MVERTDRPPSQLRAEIQALEKERQSLRRRVDELIVSDPRVKSMPDTPVRVGVPTTLARDLIQRVVAGFVDQVTLELKNLKVKKSGTVKKVVTIGQYDLNVTIHRVTGKLKTGKPEVTFGGDKVAIALPVTVASGPGKATIHFKWDGKNVAGATCGDMEVTQEVSGGVRPDTYPVSGGLVLIATAKDILAQPRFPLIKVNLKVVPSEKSWAAVDSILGGKTASAGTSSTRSTSGASSSGSSTRASTCACPPRRSSRWRCPWASSRPCRCAASRSPSPSSSATSPSRRT